MVKCLAMSYHCHTVKGTPQEIMLQIFITIVFQISSKIVSLCSLLFPKSTDYFLYSQLYIGSTSIGVTDACVTDGREGRGRGREGGGRGEGGGGGGREGGGKGGREERREGEIWGGRGWGRKEGGRLKN